MRILITGGTSAIAMKVAKFFPEDFIVFAEYEHVPHLSTPKFKYLNLGLRNENVTAHILLNYSLNEKIDLIIPLYFFEVVALSEAKVLFDEYGISLLVPDKPQVFASNSTLAPISRLLLVKEGSVLAGDKIPESIEKQAHEDKLTGIYQVIGTDTVAKLQLVTI